MTETRPTQEEQDHVMRCARILCDPNTYGARAEERAQARVLLALAAENKVLEGRVRAPIPMIIHCPECMSRHFDEDEFATKPHHTHSCQTCGLTWRPAIVPTVGVRFLPGFKNALAADDAKAAGEPPAQAEVYTSAPGSEAYRYEGRVPMADDRASRRLAYVREKAPVILAGYLTTDPQGVSDGHIRDQAIRTAGLIFDETEPCE